MIVDAGVCVATAFGGIVSKIAPPEGLRKFWVPFASVIAGLAFLSVKLLAHTSQKPTSLWTVVEFIFIVITIGLFIVYYYVFQALTFQYAGQLRIAGIKHTAHAESYLADHQTLDPTHLLGEYAGNIENVWTPGSLICSRLLLGATYCLFVACLAFTLYLGVEVLNNAWSKSPSKEGSTLKQRSSSLRDVHFELDKTDLSQDASDTLSDDAGIVKGLFQSFPNARLIVEGYCDDQGSFQHNMTLGYRRAETVRDALLEDDLSAEKIQAVSYGNTSRLCAEPTEQCRRKNRRVHLSVME
jgi:outer membrane protein OmpA-like peptidoglycan-associated protein